MPGAWQELTPAEQTLFERIRRDPLAARRAVADYVRWYQDPDTIWAWEAGAVDVPIPPAVDVPILTRPDVRAALTQMWREGARQGWAGWWMNGLP